MKDLIDLGNKAFDHLIEAHGELPESRTIFLYGITAGTTWFILGTSKSLTIEEGGIIKDFEDLTLEKLTAEWKELKFQKELAAARKIKETIKPTEHALKDGDILNFWGNEGEFREINM